MDMSKKVVSPDSEDLNSENTSNKASGSVSLNSSSLRSLKKKLKCKMSSGISSSSISRGSVNEGASIGAKDTLKAHIGCSTNDLVVDNSDDASSSTSGNSKVKDDEPNDAVKIAKGIAAKFNAFHGKLKDTGIDSGIVLSKNEIAFVTKTVLLYANAFKDELVTKAC